MSNATQIAPRNISRPSTEAPSATTQHGHAKNQSRVVTLRSEKITDEHLQRLAIVYVRQSTQQQVLEHRESTARQYALTDRAMALGWPAAAVEVIDVDQGHSGSSAAGRNGFQRLLSEVSSNRLLLGLKGTMSEAELHILKSRLQQGMWNKASRGEVLNHPPIGYVRSISARDGAGDYVIDPDEQVRAVVRLVFEQFARRGSVNGLLQWLVRNDVKLPIRPHFGANRGELEWRRPSRLASVFGVESRRRSVNRFSRCPKTCPPCGRPARRLPKIVKRSLGCSWNKSL